MKQRLKISAVAAVVYAVSFSLILYSQGEAIVYQEIGVGALVFFLAFYGLRTLLDHWKKRRDDVGHAEENQKDLSA